MRGGGGPADLKKTQGQGREHLTPACLYGTETLVMTELQQQRLQVCENNWVRKIARVTRADAQEKNGGVNGRYRSTEELDRETGEDLWAAVFKFNPYLLI